MAFVYGRFKLLKMPKLALEASMTDKLNASNALLIARIPDPSWPARPPWKSWTPTAPATGTEREKRALD